MIEIAPLLAALDACCGRRLLQGLLPGGRRDLHFVPFRAGIEIHRIYGDGVAGAAPASPGTSIEASSIVVMPGGSQEDERGVYPAGTLVIDSSRAWHSVRGEGGCGAS